MMTTHDLSNAPKNLGHRVRQILKNPVLVIMAMLISFVSFARATDANNRQIDEQKARLQQNIQLQDQQAKAFADNLCGLVVPIAQQFVITVPATDFGKVIGYTATVDGQRLHCAGAPPVPPAPILADGSSAAYDATK